MLGKVHHERDLAAGGVVLRNHRHRRHVNTRVGDDDVVGAVLDEPERLGRRVDEQTADPVLLEAPFEDRAHAHRLAREPERHTVGGATQLLEVLTQHALIDDELRPLTCIDGGVELP